MTVRVGVAEAARLLTTAREVLLLGHVNPDADALGSAFGLATALRHRGARVWVSADGAPPPPALRGLDPGDLFVPPAAVPDTVDTMVALDTAAENRLGVFAARFAAHEGTALVVDHHASNPGFGSHLLLDARAEATTSIILRLVDALDVPVDLDIARCLYAGLYTDTLGFRFATPGTHEIAARLLTAGVDPAEESRALSHTRPFAWLGLLSTVLGRAVLDRDAAGGHGAVFASVRCPDAVGVGFEDVESVIDVVRVTAEADVAVVVKQVDTGVGHGDPSATWLVSLRSVGAVDVAAVAVGLGGGGHIRAAGLTIVGTEDDVLDRLRRALPSG